MLAWYFAADDLKLRYDDGRLVRKGATHKVEGDLALCGKGLHASKRLIDALAYAPGAVVCRVKLSGKIVHGDDKCCATERTYLKVVRADNLLRDFARSCARDVLHLWDAPQVVRDYLATGNEKLRTDAANAAAYAANAAAYAAAYAANAANAANAAAYAANASKNLRDKQNRRLTRMVMKAMTA